MGVEIKGQRDGFYIVIDKEVSFLEAREKLIRKFEESGNFFKGAVFLKFDAPGLLKRDVKYLRELLEETYNVVFQDESDEKKADADRKRAGSISETSRKNQSKEKPAESKKVGESMEDIAISAKKLNEKLSSFDETIGKILKITNGESKFGETVSEAADTNLKTKFVFENMRSGAELEYDGNIVIFGDVNPGAKVTAGGNIIVMGNFRGMAHAGKKNDNPCFIAALKLLPLQIRIQDVFAVPPQDAKMISNAMVKVKNGEIEIEQF